CVTAIDCCRGPSSRRLDRAIPVTTDDHFGTDFGDYRITAFAGMTRKEAIVSVGAAGAQSEPSGGPMAETDKPYLYKEVTTLTRWAKWLLWASLAVSVISVISGIIEFRLLKAIARANSILTPRSQQPRRRTTSGRESAASPTSFYCLQPRWSCLSG